MAQLINLIVGIGAAVVVALLLLLFGLYLRGAFRENVKYRIQNVPDPEDEHFPTAIAGIANSLLTKGQATGMWIEADAIYASRLDLISRAQRTIHFETFFMTPGRRADEFAAAIIERAQAGVQVKLVIDCYGSKSLPKTYWKRLRAAGVEVRFFREFSWRAPLDFNARTHRKLLLIDGKEASIGGAGVSDDWDGRQDSGEYAPWRDFEAQFEGPIVSVLEGIFMENWASVGGTVNLSREVIQNSSQEGSLAFVTAGNFSMRESTLRMLFHTSILAAKQRLWLSSPYFVPEANIRNALLEAKRNGVDVRILTMGPRTDKPFVYYVARELYKEMLIEGIQICEYQPSMLHAKALLVDDRWVSMGSTNVDPRSFFENDELNVSLRDPRLIKEIEHFFLESFERSRCISLTHWRKRPIWQRVQGQVGLLFGNLL